MESKPDPSRKQKGRTNAEYANPLAYRHAMGVLGVEPHETWMVGDNLEWEVMAPQRIGIHAVWHDSLGNGLPEGTPARPDRIIRGLAELLG